MRVRAGSLTELREHGQLVTKAGAQPVCVVWDRDRAYAVDDRCPHMGFPLHRGTVENGLLTCHWHHARFDLVSGGTLDPFADDVRAYAVEIDGDDVYVVIEAEPDRVDHLRRRLVEGLEQGLTLVTAKAVLGLLEAGVPAADVVREGVVFGTTYRQPGWGAGLTVLVAMANLLPHLDPDDRALALVHGLAFVSRDTRGRPPRFALEPLGGDVAPDRLTSWYRRFVETRSDEAAERTLATALAASHSASDVADMMMAAATDHVFLDEGHVVDFTNKAFEALEHLGWDAAETILPTLVLQTVRARRHEEEGAWRHPDDLVALLADMEPDLLAARADSNDGLPDDEVARLAWDLLAEDPSSVADSLRAASTAGATPEQLGRALALAAALRIVRFHTQNDHGDWDVVHHGFTTANAIHQSLVRHPSPLLLRGVAQGAMKVYLDRFLNVPAARLPGAVGAVNADADVSLDALSGCWDGQGEVDRAGAVVWSFLQAGGSRAGVVAALGHALLQEDAEFHWFQTIEAAVRQASAWPEGSDESALVLVAAARFLAAHTPTRRELPQVVRIATRLRRGEPLFEEE